MPTVYTEVEVDVELSDFETDDLLDELELRGELPIDADYNAKEIVEKMYQLRRTGRSYEHLLDDLFYSVLGRVV
jgi:hypothetical protein